MAEHRFNTVIHWFRRDLRVHDNTALSEACASARYVVPLFVQDDAIRRRPDIAPARVAFLLDALKVLDKNLRRLGAPLVARRGENPDTVLAALKEYGADAVFFNRDYEPYSRLRDDRVIAGARKMGKEVLSFKDQVLVEPGELRTAADRPFSVFTPYKRAWFAHHGDAPRPAPRRITSPPGLEGAAPIGLAELGFQAGQRFECGGEDTALRLLDEFVEDRLEHYAQTRNHLAADTTSRLSRHFHFGTIGVRHAARAAVGRPGSETWLSELAWRDFYTQILWFHPEVERESLRKEYAGIEWLGLPEHFEAWKAGTTGYPIVDACMRQLNSEAWMHNRGRMIVASFLTKDLLIDWRAGERYFMQNLVDGDLAQNNGGWQWSAGTGTDAQPFFRIFNPVLQGEKFDPEGVFVRRWLPELSNVTTRYIHSPWRMPKTEQESAGCIVGRDYPAPIVDHSQQRALALQMYRKAAAEYAAAHDSPNSSPTQP